MLLALIYVLIIVAIGAMCFHLIDKFVRDGRLGNLLKISRGFVLPCRNTATAIADTRRELLGLCQQRGQFRDIRTLCPGRWQAVQLRSSIKPDLG